MTERIHARHEKYVQMSSVAGTSTGPPLSILYGSETGNTAELAGRFAGMCKSRGYAVMLAELDDVSVEDLGQMENVVVLVATCGEGALPQNCQTMWEELGRAEP